MLTNLIVSITTSVVTNVTSYDNTKELFPYFGEVPPPITKTVTTTVYGITTFTFDYAGKRYSFDDTSTRTNWVEWYTNTWVKSWGSSYVLTNSISITNELLMQPNYLAQVNTNNPEVLQFDPTNYLPFSGLDWVKKWEQWLNAQTNILTNIQTNLIIRMPQY